MRFTIAPPGTAPESPAPRPAPSLAPLGKRRKDWTSPGVYEITAAFTEDGEWFFERADDGTWAVGHFRTKTEVKDGLESLTACRRYAGSGQAQEDLEKIRAGKAA